MGTDISQLLQALSQPSGLMEVITRMFPQQQSNPQALLTQLSPQEETQFQQWMSTGGVPASEDYDMRGYWKALQTGQAPPPRIDPNDGRLHYPDTFKLPSHDTLSSESRYAGVNAPSWKGGNLVSPTGKVVFQDVPQSVVRKGGK